MSHENVELHPHHMEAFNVRDMEGLIAESDPGVGDEPQIEPLAYFDLGDQTLTFRMLHGRGRHSGAEVAMPVALVTTWRNGLAVHATGYAHREDALSDLGVSEDELEPIAP